MTAPANTVSLSFMPSPHGKLVSLTVDQYHIMLKTGILQESAPIELLDGMLVWKDRSALGEDPMTVGERHVWCIQRFSSRLPKCLEGKAMLRCQHPISIPPHNEPEPDVAVVKIDVNEYIDHKPGPGDIFSVIEVSDSSLEYDRSTKQRIYAAAGIPQYVIVNLVAGQIEVYADPRSSEGRYAEMKTISKGQIFKLKAGSSEIELNSGEFLP